MEGSAQRLIDLSKRLEIDGGVDPKANYSLRLLS